MNDCGIAAVYGKKRQTLKDRQDRTGVWCMTVDGEGTVNGTVLFRRSG